MLEKTSFDAIVSNNDAIVFEGGSVHVEDSSGQEPNALKLSGSYRTLPTGFDLQVHLRFPGQPDKETLAGGLESAFQGGYDGLLTMPNTNPFLDTPERLAAAISEFESSSPQPAVSVFFSASGTHGMQGQEPTNIAALVKAGARAITDDGWGVRSPDAMKGIFEQCAAEDVVFLQHAEMPGHGGVATASDFQKLKGYSEYPRNAESDMVARDIEILRQVPYAKYHVLHISTIETLNVVRQAKEEGLNVTCEVTPHHLIFSNADIPKDDDAKAGNYKMNPPLFTPDDRSALRQALQEGLIDCVSTDHAPHEEETKKQDWARCPFGTRGLVTALPALLTLYKNGELSWDRLVESYCFAGRRVMGLDAEASGYLVVDTEKKWTFSREHMPGKSKNSCFVGHELHGQIAARIDSTGCYQWTGN